MKNRGRCGFRPAVALLLLLLLAGCSGIGQPVSGDRDMALTFDQDYLAVHRVVVDAVRKCHPEWTTTTRAFSDLRAAYVAVKSAPTDTDAVLRVDIASAGTKRTNVNIYAADARRAQPAADLIRAWVGDRSRSCPSR